MKKYKSLPLNFEDFKLKDFCYVIKDTKTESFKKIIKALDNKLLKIVKFRNGDPKELLLKEIGGYIEHLDDLIIYCNKTKKFLKNLKDNKLEKEYFETNGINEKDNVNFVHQARLF